MEQNNNKEVRHTKGIWEVHQYKAKDVFIIYGNDKMDSLQNIADLKYTIEEGLKNVMQGEEEAQANAAFIVKACNSHYQMLDALKRFIEFFDAQKVGYESAMIREIKEAIKKAEG